MQSTLIKIFHYGGQFNLANASTVYFKAFIRIIFAYKRVIPPTYYEILQISDSTIHTKAFTKTRLYNCDPLKPHFYTVKLGFTWYTLFFLFCLKTDCGYSLEPHRRGSSNEYQKFMFWAETWKISEFFFFFLSDFFSVFGGETFYMFV